MGSEALIDLLLHLAVGRLCLSLTPPGWPGYHDRRELGATLCASLLLGFLALKLVPLPWVWAVILVVRIALLPGALRPRHELGRSGGILWEIAFLSLAIKFVLGYPDVAPVAWALGVLWLGAGIFTWTRRADRRARTLAACGLLTPLFVVFL